MITEADAIRNRFLSKIVAGSGGCWIWTAALGADGYGVFGLSSPRRTERAPRVAYELIVGPIPAGLELDHLCREPRCVNPAHLEPVTHKENVLRGNGPSAQQARWTHCPRGHEFTPDNTGHHGRKKKRQCLTCKRERDRRYYAARKAAA